MENKVDWKKSKCTICKFPLKLNITKFNNPEMTFGDYIIRFEYKFLLNIFSEEQLALAEQIRTLENYYIFFEEFIKICVGLLAFLNSNHRNFLMIVLKILWKKNFQMKQYLKLKTRFKKPI